MADNEKLFDSVAGNYDQLLHASLDKYGTDLDYYCQYKVRQVKRDLGGTRVESILEFGCGTGRNIRFLREAFPGSRVCGCDVSGESLKQARRENPGADFYTVGEALAGGGRYDLIFVAGVFHHIDPSDRTGALGQVRELLNPAGSAFIFEHNPFNPLTVRAVNTCPFDEGVQLLRPKELVERARAAGLRVLTRRFCLFVPAGLKRLAPVERALTWLPLGGQYYVRLAGS